MVSKYFGYYIFVHLKDNEFLNEFISGFIGVLNIQLVHLVNRSFVDNICIQVIPEKQNSNS